MNLSGLFQTVAENVVFVLEFLGIIAALFLIAVLLEKLEQRKNGTKGAIFTARTMAMVGMLSAMSTALMLLEIPVFFAPFFYKLDFSELPILIGTFAFGPAAGVMMEFIKILLKLLIKSTSTVFVGELANFAVGCSFIIPASAIYLFKKTRKNAIFACIVGTLTMTLFGTAFNAVYLLPAFSKLFHLQLDEILAMGAGVNPLMTEGSIVSFVAVCVGPLNLLKGTVDTVVTLLIYKPLSPFLKTGLSRK